MWHAKKFIKKMRSIFILEKERVFRSVMRFGNKVSSNQHECLLPKIKIKSQNQKNQKRRKEKKSE
jgi:hypothetical protein